MNDKITCKDHGEAFEAFVCEHLDGAPGIDWYSSEPTDEDPWPSAWCGQCHEAFSAEGEWNDRSEEAASLNVKLVCHECYEEFRDRCDVHYI